jgi:hypothetical protein
MHCEVLPVLTVEGEHTALTAETSDEEPEM